jgi:hypothetical protein
MAFPVGVFEGDFDAFKRQFDSDPLGRKQLATGHTMLRGVDNPNEIFLRVEFGSAEEAKAFQGKVRVSDVLRNVTVKGPPDRHRNGGPSHLLNPRCRRRAPLIEPTFPLVGGTTAATCGGGFARLHSLSGRRRHAS